MRPCLSSARCDLRWARHRLRTNQPTGVMTVAGTAVASTVASVVSVGEIYDLFHSVNPSYARASRRRGLAGSAAA